VPLIRLHVRARAAMASDMKSSREEINWLKKDAKENGGKNPID